LRAISVMLVVAGHYFSHNVKGPYTRFFTYQDAGVSLFFVISGFLITGILLDELKQNQTISLKHFYLKRFFRIFPAYYGFLVLSYLIMTHYGFKFSNVDITSALLYLGYYVNPLMAIVWAQSWSLAVEEHFYMVWPFVVKHVRRERLYKIVIALILLGPVFRILTFYFLPMYNFRNQLLTHTRIDGLMFGCLLSLALHYGYFAQAFEKLRAKNTAIFSLVFLTVLSPLLTQLFFHKYRSVFGYTMEGIAMLSIILFAIDKNNLKTFKILNWRPLVHLGSISYSIYLWQQLFIYYNYGPMFTFPLSLVMIYVTSLLSYLLIEYPFMRLRTRFL
jgi:peptidoglycan/LPS O-acetylase OafA/YrhL